MHTSPHLSNILAARHPPRPALGQISSKDQVQLEQPQRQNAPSRYPVYCVMRAGSLNSHLVTASFDSKLLQLSICRTSGISKIEEGTTHASPRPTAISWSMRDGAPATAFLQPGSGCAALECPPAAPSGMCPESCPGSAHLSQHMEGVWFIL